MFGSGVARGLFTTLKHYVATYADDLKTVTGRKWHPVGPLMGRLDKSTTGYLTVQYPEVKQPAAERFRFNPMLIYEEESGDIRCTSCGICAKVCPPQCIWIVQAKDSSGKTIPQCSEFYIDTSICMQCGFCSEYCPFDAIKMNHDFELSSFERHESWVYDMQELLVSTKYYGATHPTIFAAEEAARAATEAKKAAIER
jgi:NADH-quinone oxidoreductase subunit I